MVDLLGRAGELQEAYNLIHMMPMKPDSIVCARAVEPGQLHNFIEYNMQIQGSGGGVAKLTKMMTVLKLQRRPDIAL